VTPAPSIAGSVPLTRLDDSDPSLVAELLGEIERLAAASAFIGGEEVAAFEREYADYCEVAHAVAVSSGTDALVLVLRALGLGPGDEAIVPANSFIATAEAVSLCGATPRFVDVDPISHTLTAELVEPAITPRTRCVLPVHLHGRTVELAPIVELADAAGIAVVEDACQAHGARYRGRRVGPIGTAGCFSFYPAKNLGAWGDGGAVVTADPDLADRVRLLGSHGERPRYHHRCVGTTARLDAIQAAVLRVKLRRLEENTASRRDASARLTDALAGLRLDLPAALPPGHDHVYHHYVVEVHDRAALRERLAARGVASAIHYPIALHRTEAYASAGLGPGSLPVSERLAERICSLPIFPGMSADDIDRVADAVSGARARPRTAA
jgi:dTDP-4-amino-4,6-dideoxygalactose transaminase